VRERKKEREEKDIEPKSGFIKGKKEKEEEQRRQKIEKQNYRIEKSSSRVKALKWREIKSLDSKEKTQEEGNRHSRGENSHRD